MKVSIQHGQVTLMADTQTDEDFLFTLLTTFEEGGLLTAVPERSAAETILVQPAGVVK